MELPEVERRIRGSEELQMQIIRDIGAFTVALFAVSEAPNGGDRLELAGTGTLVLSDNNSHCVLTAAHVWEEVLRPAARMGITLQDDIDHQFLIDVAAIVPFGPPRPATWGPWGPDAVRLQIPTAHVGSISAYRSFYSQNVDGRLNVSGDHLELQLLMGTPAALGTFTDTHANIEINGMFMGTPVGQTHDGYDYVDFDVDVSQEGVPLTFGGVSGGGLWRVLVYSPVGSQDILWQRRLDGVAFFQFPIRDHRRTIRCHGPETVILTMHAHQG